MNIHGSSLRLARVGDSTALATVDHATGAEEPVVATFPTIKAWGRGQPPAWFVAAYDAVSFHSDAQVAALRDLRPDQIAALWGLRLASRGYLEALTAIREYLVEVLPTSRREEAGADDE